jgi:deoxyribodipyrimidine photolyase-related protein
VPPSRFLQALADLQPRRRRRRWLLVGYDQLSDRIGPLASEDPDDVGIVLIESPGKARRRPYHRQKLALLLSNLRHFALEQAARGVAVEMRVDPVGYADAAAAAARDLGPLRMLQPAEYELRTELAGLVAAGAIAILEHPGWLTTPAQFRTWCGADPPWRMDAFYRNARRDLGILMDPRGKPFGGRFSFDGENRLPWRGEPAAPVPPRFAVDEFTDEVCELVAREFVDHPGEMTPDAIAATKDDALALWHWAQRTCLPSFGPFEDAMSTRSRTLFHTQVSSLLNLHRLLPRQLIDDAVAADVALPSLEGFVRQILGWREFVHHVHRETEGFRQLAPADAAPGDGGWSRWSGRPWPTATVPELGGAVPVPLGQGQRPLPAAYWGQPSGMRCLDEVVEQVWQTGYSHHITRLMILSNIGNLLEVSARQLTDWFWVAYTDAYDWVVEPNVLAMGTFAVGDVMTTKPYVAGAAYIDRMSDYCAHCPLDPKHSCPLPRMYWAYLDRHATRLTGNQRMVVPLAALRKRSEPQRAEDRRVFEQVSAALTSGASVVGALSESLANAPVRAQKAGKTSAAAVVVTAPAPGKPARRKRV